MHRPPDDPNFKDITPPPAKKPFSMTNEVKFSWLVAAGVLVTYFSLAFFGATNIMKLEATKHTFNDVKVSKPVSFFDKSYMGDTYVEEIGPNGSPIRRKVNNK